jgi:hypothetical protein
MLIDNFTLKSVPYKETLSIAKQCLNHTNPTVKSAGNHLIRVLYLHHGKELFNQLNDLPLPTLKVITSDLEKLSPLKEDQ